MNSVSANGFLKQVTKYIPRKFVKKMSTDEDIIEVEKEIDQALPYDFKEFYKVLNDKVNLVMGFTAILPEDVHFIIKQTKKINDEVLYHLDILNQGYIKDEYYNRGRLPFAHDQNGSFIMIDFEPGAKGKVGQIIGFDSDYDKIFLISDSIQEFLYLIIDCFKTADLVYRYKDNREVVEWKNGHFFDRYLSYKEAKE